MDDAHHVGLAPEVQQQGKREPAQVFSLAFAAANHTLYAGAAAGLFASADGGAHFAKLGGIPAGQEVNFVAVDGNSGPNVFAGTRNGWFNSADGGVHFTSATGLPPRTAVFAGVVDKSSGTAFAATDKGVFTSSNLGASFIATNLNFSACFGLALWRLRRLGTRNCGRASGTFYGYANAVINS